MEDGAIPSIDLLGGEIRVVNDRDKFDQSWPTCGCCGQRESEVSWTKGDYTKLHLVVDQNGQPIRAIIRPGTTADCCQAASLRPGIQAQYSLAYKIMVARLFFKQPIKRRCGPFWRQRQIESSREITTKIYTTCGIESKMLFGILGGVESPPVRVKIQTLF